MRARTGVNRRSTRSLISFTTGLGAVAAVVSAGAAGAASLFASGCLLQAPRNRANPVTLKVRINENSPCVV